KADHLHSANHDRLAEILGAVTRRAQDRAALAGAEVKAMALAALRATREAEVTSHGQQLACIVGTPLAGEHVGDTRFDGTRSAAIFPGDLPRASDLLGHPDGARTTDLRIVRFQPPYVPDAASGAGTTWPHIRLDRALDFLIGDRLA
ncbi:MAG: YcjX family protein, partial [Alphaproteobacteria bacterium]|nr:YcjX family protein [Alphaproteobacteria bacterium]